MKYLKALLKMKKQTGGRKESAGSTARTRKNKCIYAGLMVVLLLLQSSCWDKVEVEQLAIVLAVAVDKGEGDLVRATVQTINPKGLAGGGGTGGMGGGGSGNNKAYRNLSNHGKTIFDAIRGMGGNTPRELYFSHNQVIIVSEEIAREGILKVIDFFDRNPQIRRNNWLLISKKGVNQYELLNVPNPLELVPAQRINGIIEERERTVSFVITQLGDFLELIAEKGIEAYTAGIKLSPNAATLHSTGARGEEENEETRDINVTQTAVFRGDKLVGWLNERESRGLKLVREGFNNASYSMKVGQEGGNVAVEALKGKAEIEPFITEQGEPVFNIKASVRGTVSEISNFIDLTKPENLKIIEKKLAQAIKKDIMQALEKTQREYQADVFGLGSALYRRYPGYWRQVADRWAEVYPEVEVIVDIKAEIPRTGLVSKPIKVGGE